MAAIGAGDLEKPFVQHYHTQRTKSYTSSNLYLVHVVDLEMTVLFDPVLYEGITKSMFGFGFRKIRPLNNETEFAHVARQISSRLVASRQRYLVSQKSEFELPLQIR